MSTHPLTSAQIQIARRLNKQFNVDPNELYWLGGDTPWLSSGVLTTIARVTGKFKSIEEWHDKFVPERKQVFYRARVVDMEGHEYSRTGVATIGEGLPAMATGEVADEEALASSRAITKTLDLAGFNPFKSGSVITFDDSAEQPPARSADEIRVAEVRARQSDITRIHMLAEDAGFITYTGVGRKDDSKYRQWLSATYNAGSVVGMLEAERASVIAALETICREIA